MGYYTTNSLIKVRLKMIEMCNGKHKLTRKRRERLKELLGGRTPESFWYSIKLFYPCRLSFSIFNISINFSFSFSINSISSLGVLLSDSSFLFGLTAFIS